MTINPYYLVDFCECDARTRWLASVGLAQARPIIKIVLNSFYVQPIIPKIIPA